MCAAASGKNVPGLELTLVVEAVRAQLADAMAMSAGQRVQFELGDIELDFSITVTRETRADGGIRIWVASASASHGQSTASTNRMRMVLKPTDTQSGSPPLISDSATRLPL